MVNAYKLGKGKFEWYEEYKVYVLSSSELQGDITLTEEDLLYLGATPLETESECECACHWTKGDKPFHRYGKCKCEKPEREDENTKEEHEKIKGYVLSKAVREAECEEIKMPEYLGNVLGRQVEATNAMNDWMQSVTDMLNRHEQLLREGK
jgi:hypothetical protein